MMGAMTTVDRGNRLVGRTAALAATGAALSDAEAGVGGLLLLTGEPGIGKSALLAEQARRAAARQLRVVRGAGYAEAGAPPYWLWTQVLRGLPAARLGDAARLLDRANEGEVPHPPEARFRLCDAVREVLVAAAPLLVVHDDLHWADAESLRLLEFLHHALAAEPVLLLGAYRDGEAGPDLLAAVAGAPCLPLAGLDTGEVAALIAVVAGPVPPAELADAVRRRCGGNPFFVRELTRLMVAHGDISAEVRPMPDGVRDTLRMRLVRLSRPCLDLLETAAVAGPVVTLPLLVAVGPDDPAAVTDRLEEAERARVLVANGTTWRFSHELYRECVLGLLPAQLHGAVGCALQRLSGDGTDPAAIGGAARLAAHFVAAGEPAVDAALRWSVLAAREATARLGHADAAGHYATALGLLRSNDPRQRTELLIQLAAARVSARRSRCRSGDLPPGGRPGPHVPGPGGVQRSGAGCGRSRRPVGDRRSDRDRPAGGSREPALRTHAALPGTRGPGEGAAARPGGRAGPAGRVGRR